MRVDSWRRDEPTGGLVVCFEDGRELLLTPDHSQFARLMVIAGTFPAGVTLTRDVYDSLYPEGAGNRGIVDRWRLGCYAVRARIAGLIDPRHR